MHANLISESNQIINTTFIILVTKLTKQGINHFQGFLNLIETCPVILSHIFN